MSRKNSRQVGGYRTETVETGVLSDLDRALNMLQEANKISQGDELVVYEVIAYYRQNRRLPKLNKQELLQGFYERNLRRLNSKHHLQVDSQGGAIDNPRMERHSRLQVGKLLQSEADEFNLRNLVRRIYEQDIKYLVDARHDGSKYSLLVRIWNKELSFKTPELNELCGVIWSDLYSDRGSWLPTLKWLALQTGVRLVDYKSKRQVR